MPVAGFINPPAYSADSDAALRNENPPSQAEVMQHPPLETADPAVPPDESTQPPRKQSRPSPAAAILLPAVDSNSDNIGREFEPTRSEEEARKASSDEPSQPPRRQPGLSPAAAILLPIAQSSRDLGREHESTRSKEEVDIDKKIEMLRIGPNASDEIKDQLKSLVYEHYINSEQPDTPEVQEKLSFTVKKIRPFKYGPPFLSFAEKFQLKNILKNLMDRGIIRKSNSEYISPMHLIATGGKYHLRIDYKCHLNDFIEPDKHPLPKLDEHLMILGDNKKIFSMIELEDIHNLIEIKEDCIKYTSFMTPFGQYEWRRMPLGLKIERTQFQRFMAAVLSELVDTADVVVTMSGILVATKTYEEHMQVLKHVFQRFVRNRIVIAIEKSEFLCNEIEYFDHLISLDGVRPSTKLLEPIRQFPMPRNCKDLDRFMNLCKYFKKHIEGFELIAAPLTELLQQERKFQIGKRQVEECELIAEPRNELLQKDRKLEFGERQVEAFETLKVKLTNAPTLGIFKLGDETELHCDASPHGFGAVLLQRKDDNEMHPIFYFSKRTTQIEKAAYGSNKLELYAVKYAVERFVKYLRGIEFKIVTDNESVREILNRRKLSPQLDGKMKKVFHSLNYIVEHRPRNQMEHVDALSRPIDHA